MAAWASGKRGVGGARRPRQTKSETILRELKHQPEIKYGRVRRDGDRSERDGKGRVWAYVGVRLK